MAYTPSAFDFTRPIDTDIAETAQLEFRTMKAFYRGTIGRSLATAVANSVGPVLTVQIAVPAGVMGTTRKIHFRQEGFVGNATGAAQSVAIQLGFGAAVLSSNNNIVIPANGNYAFRIRCEIENSAGTGAQTYSYEVVSWGTDSHLGAGQAAIGNFGAYGTAVVDTTVAQNFIINVFQSVASAVFVSNFGPGVLYWE